MFSFGVGPIVSREGWLSQHLFQNVALFSTFGVIAYVFVPRVLTRLQESD